MKRKTLACALMLLHNLVHAQAPAAPVVPVTAVYEQASEAMFWGAWDELERLDAAVHVDTQRTREGGLAVCQFRDGVARSYRSPSLAYHEARVAATLAWAQRRPELALAHVVHLEALSALAWYHRGGGYATTVSQQRFADFRAALDRALAYADQHAALMAGDGYAVEVMLTLLRGRGANAEQQMAAARRGLRQEPADECLYRKVIPGLMPKWGGRPQQLDQWVRESMRGLPEAEASMRYVRMYNDAVAEEYEQSLFEATLAQWPLMRDGLQRLAEAHSQGSYWRNRRAFFACMVKDRDVATQALDTIDKPDLEAWGTGAQRNYQACRRWALQS